MMKLFCSTVLAIVVLQSHIGRLFIKINLTSSYEQLKTLNEAKNAQQAIAA